MPGYLRNEVMKAVQFVALGLAGDGVASGMCLAAEYSTACNNNVDIALCAWQNVRSHWQLNAAIGMQVPWCDCRLRHVFAFCDRGNGCHASGRVCYRGCPGLHQSR